MSKTEISPALTIFEENGLDEYLGIVAARSEAYGNVRGCSDGSGRFRTSGLLEAHPAHRRADAQVRLLLPARMPLRRLIWWAVSVLIGNLELLFLY